jgi:hypothetical protein
MKVIQEAHPVWGICKRLGAILRGSGYEVAPNAGGIYSIYKRVPDRRFNKGYRLQSVAKFATFEAGDEFIKHNL